MDEIQSCELFLHVCRLNPNFARTAGFTVSLMGAGTNTTGVVRCDQPRALDLASQHARKLETVPSPIMDEVLAKLSAILE
ncbi:type II toxin-antitoxin system PemK/MazF family toxin [Xanthomonas euvesicatoria]|uniref:type II toxin-antitoxin system PemK/MazF family toxin n=1 Tax=Xanthomonas euvesicatoria TaxID=456327 RepID=UPI0031BB2054